MVSPGGSLVPVSRYQLPGCGLPVNFRPENLFTNALDSIDLKYGDVQCVFHLSVPRLA
jgi:hypothetical protein